MIAMLKIIFTVVIFIIFVSILQCVNDALVRRNSIVNAFTKYLWSNYKYTLIVIGIVLLACIIILNNYYKLQLSGWFSGIGTLLTVIVALHRPKSKPPFLRYKRYFHDGGFIVQIINDSKTNDFIELNNIFFVNHKPNNRRNYLNGIPCKGLPKDIQKYGLFYGIKGHDVYTCKICQKDLKKLLLAQKKHQKKYMVFQFVDLYKSGEDIPILFDKEDISY